MLGYNEEQYLYSLCFVNNAVIYFSFLPDKESLPQNFQDVRKGLRMCTWTIYLLTSRKTKESHRLCANTTFFSYVIMEKAKFFVRHLRT